MTTITIESNRSNSIDVNDTNSEWKTTIPDGLIIEKGDVVSIDSVMINSMSESDTMIEFVGKTGLKYDNLNIYDRAVKLDFSYYITNRQQFNFNIPKNALQLDYNIRSKTFGGPDFSTYVNFQRNYPINALEGFSTDVTAVPRVYVEIDESLNPAFMQPSPKLNNPSTDKLYIGLGEYVGPYFYNDLVINNVWQPITSDVILSVKEGFNSPASISENLTSQLHQRTGDADNWTTEFVEPLKFFINTTSGAITYTPLTVITDKTYKTFPTCTGRLFYERIKGKWNSSFNGEKDIGGNIVPAGVNYNADQAPSVFYQYIMTADKNYYQAMTTLYSYLQKNPVGSITPNVIGLYRNFSIHTGANGDINKLYEVNGRDVGLIGNNIALIDNLPSGLGEISYYNNLIGEQTNPQAKTLNLVNKNIISTNIFFNKNNIDNAIIPYFELNPIIDTDSSVINPFYFGRVDDQISQGSLNRMAQLSTSILQINPLDVGNNVGNSYITQRNQLSNGTTQNQVAMYGNNSFQFNKHFIYPIFPDSNFNVVNAMNNNIIGCENLFPHRADSIFMTSHPSGNINDLKAIWADNVLNTGVIPVFIKSQDSATDSRLGSNAYLIPFIGFIYKKSENPINAHPSAGEYCLIDPSLNVCDLSIIATTQKNQDETQPYPQANTGATVNTDPQTYSACITVGSNDCLINFDGNFSKFTFSQLHTASNTGNGQFQNPYEPPSSNALQNIMSVNEKVAMFCNTDPDFQIRSYNSIQASSKVVISSQCGISLTSISLLVDNGDNLLNSNFLKLTQLNKNYYKNCLLDILGFNFNQLMPPYGKQNNSFNRGNYNLYLNDGTPYQQYNNVVKEFTTNAYISSSDQISFSQMAGYENSNNLIVPSGNLGLGNIAQSNVNADSDLLIAYALPRKLAYSYLVIYSDIIKNSNRYFGGITGSQILPALGYVSRSFETGNFFFGSGNFTEFLVDKDYVITDIKTKIYMPDGSPVKNLGNNCTVIYKIIKNV
jgi:hypothetical protein